MKTKKLFNSINPAFFNVLSSPNKEIYTDCIFLIHDLLDSVEHAFQGERDVVVQLLMQYFEDMEDDIVEDGEFLKTLTPRQKSNHVLNYLRDCGWIGEEELGDYKTSVNLFDYSIMIIEVLKSIISGEQFEYSGEIYIVYSLLKNFKKEEGVGIIEQAKLQTMKITRRLRALKANIYRYYYDITKNKKGDSLAQILETLLVEYKNNFFDKAYFNLKTKDSLPKYKGLILQLVASIYDDEVTMTELAEMLMKEKGIENFDDAYHEIEQNLREIKNSFNAFDGLISEIDTKNEQYISASAAKIMFLTNRSDDIEGIINRILDAFLKNKIDTDISQNFFNLVNCRNIDSDSLHTPRVYREIIDGDQLLYGNDIISDDLMKQKLNLLMKNNIYGKKEINKYAMKLLENKDQIYASEFLIEDREDLVKLVLIFLYSRSTQIGYTCEVLQNIVVNNFLTFQDFIIKPRRKNWWF